MLKRPGGQGLSRRGVGRRAEKRIKRCALADRDIDDRFVLDLDDRPTTLKERYIGRAQDRHPQQMMRVDYETCGSGRPRGDRIGSLVAIPEVVAEADIVLISDYDKGVCTPRLLQRLILTCRSLGVWPLLV